MNDELVSSVTTVLELVHGRHLEPEDAARAIIPLVLEHERERCASACAEIAEDRYNQGLADCGDTATECVAVIRGAA